MRDRAFTHLCDLPALVVSSDESYTVWVSNLRTHQKEPTLVVILKHKRENMKHKHPPVRYLEGEQK